MSEPDGIVVNPNSKEAETAEMQRRLSFHELLLSGKPFTLNGVRFAPKLNPGPTSWSLGGSSEPPKRLS